MEYDFKYYDYYAYVKKQHIIKADQNVLLKMAKNKIYFKEIAEYRPPKTPDRYTIYFSFENFSHEEQRYGLENINEKLAKAIYCFIQASKITCDLTILYAREENGKIVAKTAGGLPLDILINRHPDLNWVLPEYYRR